MDAAGVDGWHCDDFCAHIEACAARHDLQPESTSRRRDHAQQERESKAAVETDRCLICLEPPHEPTRLPCGHSFCMGCVAELRAKGVSETCPLCRAPLPPGPEKLYELGSRVRAKVGRGVARHDYSWAPLSAPQQDEMDGAIVMFQEATDQVSRRLVS